jgi:hypothetical protein
MAARTTVTTFLATVCGVLLVVSTPGAGQLASEQNGRYRHVKSGVEFPVPSGWSVTGTNPSSDGGEQTTLLNATAPFTYVAVWMKPVVNTSTEVNAGLEQVVSAKLDQRMGIYPGYQFRSESIQLLRIGDHSAVKAVADLVQPTFRAGKAVEYFTWIFTERTRAQFYVRGAEPGAGSAALRLEEIIQSATIP